MFVTRNLVGNLCTSLYGPNKSRPQNQPPGTIQRPEPTITPTQTVHGRATTHTLFTPTSRLTTLPTTPSPKPSLFPHFLPSDSLPPGIDTNKIIKLMQNGLAKGTIGNYVSAIKSFHTFCDSVGIDQNHRFPASELVLCAFASSLDGKLAGTTANTTITALKRMHELHNLPWNGSDRMYLMLKGIGNNAPASSKRQKRFAITTKMLQDLRDSLDQEHPKDAAVLACAFLAFFGQARLGEFLGSSRLKHDARRHPSRNSVIIIFSNNAREIHLPRTKTNQANGQSIVITRQCDPLDPVKALENHFRINQGLDDNDHLFAFHSHSSRSGRHSLTHEDFIKRVNEVWTSLGYPKVTGHSFRIGGTTTLLKSGVPPEVVKELGRWSSDAFFEYWRDLPGIASHHVQFLDLSSTSHAPLRTTPVSQARRSQTVSTGRVAQLRPQGRPTFSPY